MKKVNKKIDYFINIYRLLAIAIVPKHIAVVLNTLTHFLLLN